MKFFNQKIDLLYKHVLFTWLEKKQRFLNCVVTFTFKLILEIIVK